MKLTSRIAFIGGGNMGTALIGGLLRQELVTPDDLIVAEANPERREFILDEYGVSVTADNNEAVQAAEVVVLAVKPQVMEIVLRQIAPDVGECLIISIAAGITTRYIEKLLPPQSRVVRVMPNTPAQVGLGAAAYCLGSQANDDDANVTEELLGAVGLCLKVDEKQLNAVTGLSGSGPAYVFEFLGALIDAGVYVGLTRETAEQLASQTILGALKMYIENDQHPRSLRDMVSSPGGTTVEALAVLAKGGFSSLVLEAVKAATLKSEKLEK